MVQGTVLMEKDVGVVVTLTNGATGIATKPHHVPSGKVYKAGQKVRALVLDVSKLGIADLSFREDLVDSSSGGGGGGDGGKKKAKGGKKDDKAAKVVSKVGQEVEVEVQLVKKEGILVLTLPQHGNRVGYDMTHCFLITSSSLSL